MNTKTLPLRNSVTRSALGAFLLSSFVLTCLAVSQTAEAECPQSCDDNFNTALGISQVNGYENTIIGTQGGQTGWYDTVVGALAGFLLSGNANTAIRDKAIANANVGNDNTAVGYAALSYCSGDNNIGIGVVGGTKLTNGSDNIDIGNQGEADDARTIRIGNIKTQRHTYIAGISGVTVADGVNVVINANGHLGTTTSSARFKQDIKSIDKASEAILALKPVTFRYKHDLDPEGIPQIGLVAEDVEKVNPDLVARDEQGKPYTVRYEAVNAMLLNEFLKEYGKVQKLEATVAQQRKDFDAAVAELKGQIQKVSAQLELSN